MSAEELYGFCIDNSLFSGLRQKDRNVGSLEETVNEATHYMMNGKGGGVLVVPDSMHTEFLKIYSKDIQNGVIHYLIEKRTPLFRWMADLDFKGPKEIVREQIIMYVKKIQTVIRSFYPDVNDMKNENCFFDVIVLTTELGIHETTGEVKTGIHLVMPNLPVTQAECLDMRLTLVAEFEMMGKKTNTELHGWNSWEDILDECVYRSNGLRMPGSHKTLPCPICQRDPIKKKVCKKCRRKGYLDGKRVYAPSMYVSQDGTLSEERLKILRQDAWKMIKYTSIRLFSDHEKPEWVLPKNAPSYPHSTNAIEYDEREETDIMFLKGVREVKGKAEINQKKRKRDAQTNSGASRFTEDDDSLKTWKNKIVLDNNGETVSSMQQFLRSSINSVYGQIQIREMFSTSKKPFFVITTKGYGSQNCMNMIGNAKHNTNTIYFLVTARGVSQRCFCKCSGADKLKVRREGLCKNYRSPNIALTKELLRKLFPTKLNTNPLLSTIEVSRFESNPAGYQSALKRILVEQDEKLFNNVPVLPPLTEADLVRLEQEFISEENETPPTVLEEEEGIMTPQTVLEEEEEVISEEEEEGYRNLKHIRSI